MPTCDTIAQIVVGLQIIANLIIVLVTRNAAKDIKEKVDTNTAITLSTNAAVTRPSHARTRSTDTR